PRSGYRPPCVKAVVLEKFRGKVRSQDRKSQDDAIWLPAVDHSVEALRFSPDGKTLAVGTDDGKGQLWSGASGALRWEERPRKGGRKQPVLTCVAFFPDGKKLVTGGEDSKVSVLDVRTGKVLHSYLAHRYTVWQVAVSPDGKYVGSYGLDGCVNVWGK